MNKERLAREQLDQTLKSFGPLRNTGIPSKGWIRAIRDALGMTARQLAERLGVTQQSVARIEKGEAGGAVTLRTLRRIAEGLNCTFVYGFVPKQSLEDTVRKRAGVIAVKRLAEASQSMALEEQALSEKEDGRVLDEMIDQLADSTPSDLWDMQ